MIAKKPVKSASKTASKEKTFISKGSASNGNGSARPGRQLSLKPVLVNFDQALLDRATSAAQSMGLNRNAFICMAVAIYLNKENRE